ncbi:hypothetical protein BJ508DRAFT_72895 [Ascobolus immersus RN42]|uniref:Uncharacterized protein n=1 Tax=Ascobolus immersus RN42 TaxID=1160509 RepID=A0A3N4HE49_ASCIM|nr:hypothetical protein BJ508DRAFT_72895 [Ascobolus immersus RN42]
MNGERPIIPPSQTDSMSLQHLQTRHRRQGASTPIWNELPPNESITAERDTPAGGPNRNTTAGEHYDGRIALSKNNSTAEGSTTERTNSTAEGQHRRRTAPPKNSTAEGQHRRRIVLSVSISAKRHHCRTAPSPNETPIPPESIITKGGKGGSGIPKPTHF